MDECCRGQGVARLGTDTLLRSWMHVRLKRSLGQGTVLVDHLAQATKQSWKKTCSFDLIYALNQPII